MSEKTVKLFREARERFFSDEEKEEQRRSFVHGNCALHNPEVIRKLVDEVADEQKEKEV